MGGHVRKMAAWAVLLLGVSPSFAAAPPTLTGRDCYGDPLPPGAVMRLGTVRFRHGLRIGSGLARLSFSPDNRTLLSVGHVGMKVWVAQTGEEIPWSVPDRVRAAAFTPDGKTLVLAVSVITGGRRDRKETRYLQRWDFGTRKLLRKAELPPPSRSGEELFAFSSDARVLIISDRQGKITLCDESGKILAEIPSKGDDWYHYGLSPDNRLIALGGSPGILTVYDAVRGEKLHELRSEDARYGFVRPCFSPDGKHLLARGETYLHLWDVKTGKLLQKKEGRVPVAYSADGKQLACVGRDAIHLLDPQDLRILWTFEPHHERMPRHLTFSPDGKKLALGGEYSISVWDVTTGKKLNDSGGHHSTVRSLAFSSCGTRLASGGDDGAACVWDLATGKQQVRFRDHCNSVPGLAFSPDGKTLATGEGQSTTGRDSSETHVRLFDLARPTRPSVQRSPALRQHDTVLPGRQDTGNRRQRRPRSGVGNRHGPASLAGSTQYLAPPRFRRRRPSAAHR